MLCIVGVVNAKVEQVHATFASPTNTGTSWDAATKTFKWNATSYNQLRNIGLPSGDLTKYKKLVVDLSFVTGNRIRVLIYKGGANKTLYAKEGKNEFILADTLKAMYPDDYNEFLRECTEVCISGDNAIAPGEVVVNSVYLETYPENETVDIPEVVVEEDPGRPAGDFVDLTQELFSGNATLNLGKKLGKGETVYGAKSIDAFADLSDYSKLTIVATPGMMFNINLNHQVEIKNSDADYGEEDLGKFDWINAQTGEDGIYELDLTQFENRNLNCIWTPWAYEKMGTVWYLLLTKKDAAPVAQEVTFDFNASNHATSNDGNAGDITAEEVNTVDGVVMTISPADEGVTPPNRYWKYNEVPQLRMYSGKITLTAPEGKAITKVVINNIKWNDGNTFNGEAAAEGNWEGNSTNVVLAVAKNTQMNKIVVTLADKNEETTTYKEPLKPLFADGKYYFYNIGTKKYLAAGANWGTHAFANATGLDYGVAFTAEGKYTLESQVSNGGDKHFLNGEYNDGLAYGWTIAKVADGVYTISDGTKFLTAAEDGLVTLGTDGTAEAAQWQVKSFADRLAELATATAENPVNATFLIKCANFDRNDQRKSGWKMEASNQNLSGGEDGSGSVGNNCAESFHSVFTLSQVLKDAPAGKYQLTAQGFYRQDGSDNDNLPFFYANDSKKTFPERSGTENSMTDAGKSFKTGSYTIEPIEVTVFEDGGLTIGAKLENNTNLWCIFDNFQLTYLTSEIPADEFKPAYEAALATAQAALANENYAAVTGTEKAALEKAIADNTTVEETVDAYKAAISALTAATEAFTGAKADYEALPAAKEAVKDLTFKYATAEKKAAAEATLTAEATSAADAKEKAAAIEKAYRQYAESSALLEGVEGSGLCTDSIVNPNAEDGINGWTLTGKANTKSNESFIDGDGKKDYKYFDSDQWGDNSWDISLTQKIALPAGKYQLTVTGRASADVDMKVFAGTDSATVASIGATNGLYTFGWNDASVEFELAEADSVVIGVRGVTSANHNWMSFTRFRLAIFEAPIEVQPDDPEPAVPEGWENLIANGNMAGDDVSNFFSKEAPAPDPYASTITPGAGKDNSRGIIIKSINSGGQDWDSQFFIRANKQIPAGTKLHMEFDYKATAAANVSTQGHGEPGGYVNNDGVGTVKFTTEWQHLSQDFTTSGDIQTIAFNMNVLRDEASYYIDNIVFWAEKPAEIEWADIIVNGTMEENDAFNFKSKIHPAENASDAAFTAGAGKDGSQGIVIESPAKASNPWDTQFWITLPIALEQGTMFKVEFDYKADAAVNADTQYHAAPGDYIGNWSSIGFTTEWQHYEKQGIAPGANNNGNKFQSIAFNLSFDNATNLYFDNVKLFLDKETAATGIKSVNTETPFIEGAVYDLQGRRVAKPARGLYIINGKKVMVK